MLDEDGSGDIGADEVFSMMKKLGNPITMEEAQAMIREADIDGSGSVSYVELVQMVQPQPVGSEVDGRTSPPQDPREGGNPPKFETHFEVLDVK